MRAGDWLRLYAVGVAVCFGLDLVWLGVVAKGFYQRQFGTLMRPDPQWLPATLFYLVYVAAVVVLAAAPALERGPLSHALGRGALLGLAAYSAFDLTGLALLRGFPVEAALVDMAWGSALSAVVSWVVAFAGRTWR